ncbi:protein indeterminate-domain 6, chloroplastic-like [Curcuma longa]|uniref:protein indeterminate-domain 6, chloroplastic-like n=1 Tax=Curcuma longa TaxID=136217 RepID=UPI003D9EEBE5
MKAAPSSSSSSMHYFGLIRDEDHQLIHQTLPQLPSQQLVAAPPPPPPPPGSSSTTDTSPATVPPKKKRNLPGNPNPDAEVIALSPKTLMATNRFICEVCSKGFQREQNLQLHRRGHNLPWKLKQKNPNEVRRRVYLCPEPTCVHHDPSRALGDLTGIKKHFCRKHGEKKWKCDKCSKRYAVQSDWKAHSKICGTREYRCDCGTLFSRRDSFITHRAFCDALAQENARLPPAGLSSAIGGAAGQIFASRSINLGLPQLNSAQLSSFQDHQDPVQPPQPNSDHHHLLHSRSRINMSSSQFDVVMANQHLNNTVAFRAPPPPHQLPHSSPFFLGMEDGAAAPALLHGGQGFGGASANNNSNLFNLGCFFPTKIEGDEQQGNEAAMPLFGGSELMGHHEGPTMSSLYNPEAPPLLPQMSATALLQKAAQMGATSADGGSIFLRDFGGESSRSANERQYQEMIMNSLGGFHQQGFMHDVEEEKLNQRLSTRDFLGVNGSVMRSMMDPATISDHNMQGSSMDHSTSSTPSFKNAGGRLQ